MQNAYLTNLHTSGYLGHPTDELVDANGCIQKVRVEPATRSAVATCNRL